MNSFITVTTISLLVHEIDIQHAFSTAALYTALTATRKIAKISWDPNSQRFLSLARGFPVRELYDNS